MGHSNCDTCGHDKKMCVCTTYVAQEGGEHYQAEYQHWDWAIDINLNYLEAAASKYVTRWRKKTGVLDVKKGISYLKKIRGAYKAKGYRNKVEGSNEYVNDMTLRFCTINQLASFETAFMLNIAFWKDVGDIDALIDAAERILRRAEDIQEASGGLAAGRVAGAGHAAPQGSSPDVSGRAGGTVGQAATGSASTEPRKQGSLGMERPFGYDGDG